MRCKFLFVLCFVFGIFAGCRTAEETSDSQAFGPTKGGGTPPPSATVIDVPTTATCAKTNNTYGFPVVCVCPANYEYNAVIGKCTDTKRMCTMAIVEMFHPATGNCIHAKDGCSASDLTTGGWQRKLATDQCGPVTTGPKNVAGFDFVGLKIMESLPANFACPQVVIAESDACLAKNAVPSYTKNCAILCSQPIAKKGSVAGYDFKGPRIALALPANGACPQLANAETDACLNINGSTTYDKSCKTLCSLPIAKKGRVAGFDFKGFKTAAALPANSACPQVALAESDACLNLQGETSYTKTCGILCNVPIAK